jgi:hypothetical protein
MFDTNLSYNQPITIANHIEHYPELNRLLSAAIVSVGFRNMLINNPETAITKGYQGEKFNLTDDEYRWLVSVQATDLASFASQLLEYQNTGKSVKNLSYAVQFPAMAHVS